jgi:hypothetical protein
MKSIRKLLLCGIASLSIVSSPAQADDETKRLIGGLAAGLVGMAINEMANQDEAQAEEIDWNDNQQKKKGGSAVSQETRDIQRDLKELGYYQGTVDGISGAGTQKAILKWEADNCLEDDNYCRNGKLDQIELDVLKDHAENERNNKKIAERNDQRAKERAEKEKNITLEDLLYDQARNAEQYEICKNFKDNYANFSYSIDKHLERNYSRYSESNDRAVKNLVSCKGLSQQDTAEIRDSQQEKYDESQESKMTRIRAGYVFTEDGEDRELILRCNLLSNYLKERSVFLSEKDGCEK